jgi:transmembrane sensor
MDRLSHELAQAGQELCPNWTEERNARLFSATVRLGRRRAARRAVALSAATFAAAAIFGVALEQMLQPEPQHASAPARRTGHTLRLADGSRADMVGNQSELEASHNSPDRVELHLIAGRAHFDVVPNPRRSFVIEVPPYRVQVIGTIFDVERTERDVAVTVTRGKVRVVGPHGSIDLQVGESRRFELHAPPAVPQPSAAEPAAMPPPAAVLQPPTDDAADSGEPVNAQRPAARTRAGAGRSGWRSLSQSGQYEAAFESLSRSGTVEDEPAALMDAADAARLSGHAETAVRYLTRVARSHRKSKVAPLAAFTLGRVYLEELGQPDRAAEAFALAQELAPAGSMAQDALAREVEALSKAGNAQQAFVRAQKYLSRYPNGRRLRAVQLYGGVH